MVPPRDSNAVGERLCPVFTEAFPSHILCMWNSLLSQEQSLFHGASVGSGEHCSSTNLFQLKDFFVFYHGGE